MAPKLQDLSLAANLLPSWEEVSRLAEELPQLHNLDLSSNRMAFPAIPVNTLGRRFAALRLLVLNHCCISWDQVNNDCRHYTTLQGSEVVCIVKHIALRRFLPLNFLCVIRLQISKKQCRPLRSFDSVAMA